MCALHCTAFSFVTNFSKTFEKNVKKQSKKSYTGRATNVVQHGPCVMQKTLIPTNVRNMMGVGCL